MGKFNKCKSQQECIRCASDTAGSVDDFTILPLALWQHWLLWISTLFVDKLISSLKVMFFLSCKSNFCVNYNKTLLITIYFFLQNKYTTNNKKIKSKIAYWFLCWINRWMVLFYCHHLFTSEHFIFISKIFSHKN